MESWVNLFVDDIRKAPDGFIVARSYKEAIDLISSNKINILCLDHDLGIDEYGVEKNGYDIVKYLCEHRISPQRIYLHTDNAVGRENMYNTLVGARKRGFISSNTEIYRYQYEDKYGV